MLLYYYNTWQFTHGFQIKFIYFDNDPWVGWGRWYHDHLTEESSAQEGQVSLIQDYMDLSNSFLLTLSRFNIDKMFILLRLL